MSGMLLRIGPLVLAASCAASTPASIESAATTVVAHRGSSAAAPENTLAAIAAASELGVEIVELDVQTSADGIAFLLHDEELDRTTNATGVAAERPWAELSQLDAGRWFDAGFDGEPVPSLEDVMRRVADGPDLMLDLKSERPCAAIADALRATELPPERIIIGCWDDGQLADARAHLPDAATVHIAEAPADAGPAWVRDLQREGYDALSLKWDGLPEAVLAEALKSELALYVWTLNDADSVEAALNAGVDGIITDDPALVLDLRR